MARLGAAAGAAIDFCNSAALHSCSSYCLNKEGKKVKCRMGFGERDSCPTSPSADFDSSEICQKLTQAEYRLEVAMYQLISLERCSRPATVASEENEREPYDRKVPQAPQADHWPRTAGELPLELKRELVRHRNKKKRFIDCM